MTVEKYTKGYGILGSGMWFGIVGFSGFAIFWVACIPIVIYFIWDNFKDLWRNN